MEVEDNLKKQFDIVSKATEEYIKEAEIESIDDILLVKKFAHILLKTEDVDYYYKYNNSVSFKESDMLVSDFLESLNTKYKDYYDIRKEDGSFIFEYIPEYGDHPFSTYDTEINQRIMYIPLENTLEDSCVIVHELMHDINMDIENDSEVRTIYTEAISILAEFIFKDYLKNKKVKQYQLPVNRTLYSLKQYAISADFNIKLIEKYLSDGYLDRGSIFEILEQYPDDYLEILEVIFHDIVDNGELSLDMDQRYVVGALIATYMYDRIKVKKTNILELFELNQMLPVYEFDQVLDYLDLEHDEDDLLAESYDKLSKAYKKFLKTR